MKDLQGRKFLLTINNPSEAGLTLAKIDETVKTLNPQYFCRCMERGEKGTEHYHIALFRPSPIRFSTLKRLFPTAHIERAGGSMTANRDYVQKGGKWEGTAKANTSIPDTFAEYGTLPDKVEEQGKKSALLLQAIKNGKSNAELLEEFPEYALRLQNIDVLRESLRREEMKNAVRELDVSYLYGATGTGKTRSIYDAHPPEDICRITTYPSNGVRFDSYHGQPVLVFEEFTSQIPLSDMLNYLDRYYLELPARYTDHIACYNTVYITSNLPLEDQYTHEQNERRAAFYRRINHIVEFRADGTQNILK